MVRLGVSPNVLRTIRKLAKTGKPIPLIKYSLPPKLKIGDIVSIKSKPTSIRARVVDIKEYSVFDKDIPFDELLTVYGEMGLKGIFGNLHIKKFYVVYVEPVPF